MSGELERTFDADVSRALGVSLRGSASQRHYDLARGYARVRVPGLSASDLVPTTLLLAPLSVKFRREGSGVPVGEYPEVIQFSGPTWYAHLVAACAAVLATGRTGECGPGIGIFDDPVGEKGWRWDVNGKPCDYGWEYLVGVARGGEDVRGGYVDRRVPWNLSPDYQRGPVWSAEQQGRFIGHVLAGGPVPPIYVQRLEGPANAPGGRKEDYYLIPEEVVDGQQRLRAILAFMADEVPALVWHGGAWHSYFYRQTNEVERRSMSVMSSRVIFVDLPREERLRFYLRLNSGVPHSDADLDKVRAMLSGAGT